MHAPDLASARPAKNGALAAALAACALSLAWPGVAQATTTGPSSASSAPAAAPAGVCELITAVFDVVYPDPNEKSDRSILPQLEALERILPTLGGHSPCSMPIPSPQERGIAWTAEYNRKDCELLARFPTHDEDSRAQRMLAESELLTSFRAKSRFLNEQNLGCESSSGKPDPKTVEADNRTAAALVVATLKQASDLDSRLSARMNLGPSVLDEGPGGSRPRTAPPAPATEATLVAPYPPYHPGSSATPAGTSADSAMP